MTLHNSGNSKFESSDGTKCKSPDGAKYESPGQRPGYAWIGLGIALKGRDNGYFAPSGLRHFIVVQFPRALPWAFISRPFRPGEIQPMT